MTRVHVDSLKQLRIYQEDMLPNLALKKPNLTSPQPPSLFPLMQYVFNLFASFCTFRVEGDKAVTEGPFLHRFLQDHLLRKDDHVDVVKLTKALQDLSHGL